MAACGRNLPCKAPAFCSADFCWPASLAPAASRRAAAAWPGCRPTSAHQLALAGPADGAYVYDLTPNRRCSPSAPRTMRPPASVEKLYTATTALEQMGAIDAPGDDRLRRRAPGARRRLGRQPVPARRRRPDVRLDARSSTATTAASARASPRSSASSCAPTASTTSPARSRAMSPTSTRCAASPPATTQRDPFLEGTLSALAFNRGETGSRTRRARAGGIRRARAVGGAEERRRQHPRRAAAPPPRPPAPTSSRRRSRRRSRSCSALMLPPSDNFFAETLVKDLGARYGGAGTTAAGAAVVIKTISSLLGIHPHVVDGSGLSEADKTSPYQVADLLVELAPTPIGTVLREQPRRRRAHGHARTAHAPHAAPPGTARARPERSPASRTSSATARPPTGTRSRSRSSPTASPPKPRTPSRTTWRSPSPATERLPSCGSSGSSAAIRSARDLDRSSP